MKIVHVSPMYFSDRSNIGGAERYVMELGRAMADIVPAVLVTFGTTRETFFLGRLRVEVYPARFLSRRKERPLELTFLRQLADADVVHCHNLGSPATSLALSFARLLRKSRYVTPLGLLPTRLEHRVLRVVGLTGMLCISQFSAREAALYGAPQQLICGGVDAETFHPLDRPKEQKVVCVARIVPVKGINYLVEAADPDMRVEIYGRVYDRRYYCDLQALARGKNIHFYTEASNEEVAAAYATALVAVLPTVHRDMYGGYAAQPELLGLVLLEAMASGTAVVGTRVGAIPEYIDEGVTGYLVPPNDPAALRSVLRRLYDNPDEPTRLGLNGLRLAREKYTWQAVAERCLHAYGTRARLALD